MKKKVAGLLVLAIIFCAGVSFAGSTPQEAWVVSGGFSSIALDAQGNVFGIRQGNPVPYDRGGQIFYGYSLLTTKIDTNGNELWTAAHPGFDLGHDLYQYPTEAAVDSLGNVHALWWEMCWAAFHSNAAMVSYDPGGNLIGQYSLWITNWTNPSSLAVDAAGNRYISGNYRTGGWGVPIEFHLFIIKYDAAGNVVQHIDPAVGSPWASDLAVDASQNVYMTSGGYTVKFDAALNQIWAAQVDGGKIAVDAEGNVYVVSGAGLAKLDADGNLLWTVNVSGSDVALDSDGNVYVVGPYGAFKYDGEGNSLWTLPVAGSTIRIDADKNIYICDGNIRKFIANSPPVADAGADQTVEMTTISGASVTLDGSGSSDPDNDALSYTWTWPDGTASGVNPVIALPLGTTTVTLTVDDGNGETAVDTVTYQVIATPNGSTALLDNLVSSGLVDPNVAGSLLAKLDSVMHAGNPAAADGKLQAFINEINAQAGKKITPEAAAVLISAARYMIDNN